MGFGQIGFIFGWGKWVKGERMGGELRAMSGEKEKEAGELRALSWEL